MKGFELEAKLEPLKTTEVDRWTNKLEMKETGLNAVWSRDSGASVDSNEFESFQPSTRADLD